MGESFLTLVVDGDVVSLSARQLHYGYTLIRRLSQSRPECLGEEIKLWPHPGIELRRYLSKDEFLNFHTFWNDQIENEMG